MTEPTSAEKNRVVAERWLGIKFRKESRAYETGFYRYGQWYGTNPPDFPNDPVAADALEQALAAADYEMEFSYARGVWMVDLGPYEADDWTGMANSRNKNEALRDAAYDATMAERSEAR